MRPRYTPVQRQVDRLVSYSGLPDNDVARIPASRTFEVTSFGDGADTVETGTLALSDIAYAVERTDEFGLPVSYRADCCYRGQESYSVVTGYDAVAVYRGECPVDDAMMKVSATYRPQPPLALTVSTTNTPTTAPTTATAPVQAVEETVEPVPWAQLGATGMALALGGSLFLFFRFGRRKRKTDSAACTISTGASNPVAPRAASSVSTRGTDSAPARTSGSVPIGATGAPSDKTSGAYVPLTRKRSL